MKLILKKSSLMFKVSDLVVVGDSNVICTSQTNTQYHWFLKLPSELEGVLKTLKMAFSVAGDLSIGLLSYAGDITAASSSQLTSAIYLERVPYTVSADEIRTSPYNRIPNKFKVFNLETPLRRNSYIILKSSDNLGMCVAAEDHGIPCSRTNSASWGAPSVSTPLIVEAVIKKA